MSMMGERYGHDWPLEIAGAHGRISAYRAALVKARWALRHARPYVDDSVVHDEVNEAVRQVEAELAVFTIPPRSPA